MTNNPMGCMDFDHDDDPKPAPLRERFELAVLAVLALTFIAAFLYWIGVFSFHLSDWWDAL